MGSLLDRQLTTRLEWHQAERAQDCGQGLGRVRQVVGKANRAEPGSQEPESQELHKASIGE
jgi:hypothetical protein